MKIVQTKIPDKLDRAIDSLVTLGWFSNREQIIHEAIRRFLDAHHPELMEKFIREDVEWGLSGRR
jgi:Arc/MetJ-type ribon-helix-helix transcriptional regulator